jgi:hypothetical protein
VIDDLVVNDDGDAQAWHAQRIHLSLKKTFEHVRRDHFAIEGGELRHRRTAEVRQPKENQSGGEEMSFHIGVNLPKEVGRAFSVLEGIDSIGQRG